MSRKKLRHLMAAGWVPNQHGAWAMLITPYVIGVAERIRAVGFDPAVIALGLVWFIGYFTFHVTSLWLKSGRKAKYHKPMLTYGIGTAVAGILVLLLRPAAAWWVPVFAPFLLTGLWYAHRRNDRAVTSGLVTVAAACLMAPVVYADTMPGFFADVAAGGPSRPVAAAAIILFLYFFGTVFYVKTMIRERGDRGYLVASLAFHVTSTVLTALAAAAGEVSILVPVFFAVTVVRSAVMPWLAARRGRGLRPGYLGIVEIVLSVVLGFTLLLT